MMKHNLTHRSVLCIGIAASFSVFAALQSEAQSIKRQSIASNGSAATIDGISIRQTIGQPYFTSAYYDNETGLRPGFQQFSRFNLELIQSAYLNLKVYPNPAVETVTLESENAIKDALIQVRDINGKLLLNETIAELKTYSIHCETWTNGAYFIHLSDKNNTTYLSKLIITK